MDSISCYFDVFELPQPQSATDLSIKAKTLWNCQWMAPWYNTNNY